MARGDRTRIQAYEMKPIDGKTKKGRLHIALEQTALQKLRSIPEWSDKLRAAIDQLIKEELGGE